MRWYYDQIVKESASGDNSVEDFLARIGVPEETISYVTTITSPELKQQVIGYLRKFPQTPSALLMEKIRPQNQQPQQNPNTPQELQLANRFQNLEFQKWLLVSLRKARNEYQIKKKPDGMALTGDGYSIPGRGNVNFTLIPDIAQSIFDWYVRGVLPARQAFQAAQTPEEKAIVINEYGVTNANTNLAGLTLDQADQFAENWHDVISGEGEGLEYYGEKREDIVFGPQWSRPDWAGWTIKQVVTKNNLRTEGGKMGHCFTAGSLVRTKKGFIPIEEIEIGDLVLVENGTFQKVTEKFERDYVGEIIKLQTRLGTDPIYVTPEHLFLSLKSNHKGSKPCRLHTCGSLCRNNKPEEKHIIEWQPIESLRDSYILSRVPKEFEDINEIKIPDHCIINESKGNKIYNVDKDLLWIFGIYIAEGSNDGDKLSFALSKTEIEYVNRIFDFFSKNGFSPRIRKDSEEFGGIVVLVNSRMLCRWFSEMFGCGCSNKKIPSQFLNLPNEKIVYIWQGIFDGDGCKGRNVLHQTSKELALQMTEISLRLGGFPSLSKKDNTKRNRKTAYVLEGADASIKRDSRKANFWIHKKEVLVKPVCHKKTQFTGKVYNIEVEGIHSYVVQHLVAHNCVGSYCNDVLKGNTRIFSLRDPANIPYVTMEVDPKSWTFRQIYGNGPKTGNTDPSDNLKAMIGEWMRTLKGATIEGMSDFDYSDLSYGSLDDDLERAIYKGAEGYGLPISLTGWEYEDAYEAVYNTLNNDRGYRNDGGYQTHHVSKVLARAAVDSDVQKLNEGVINEKEMKAMALNLAHKTPKHHVVTREHFDRMSPENKKEYLKEYLPEAAAAVKRETDQALKDKWMGWEKYTNPQAVEQKTLEKAYYNMSQAKEFDYSKIRSFDQLDPKNQQRFMSQAIDSYFQIAQIYNKRQENDEKFYDYYDDSYLEFPDEPQEDDFKDPEEYQKAISDWEDEKQQIQDEAADTARQENLPYCLDDAVIEDVEKILMQTQIKLPRWLSKYFAKAKERSHYPTILWTLEKVNRKKKEAAKGKFKRKSNGWYNVCKFSKK
jgi:intein/homing endonuclease